MGEVGLGLAPGIGDSSRLSDGDLAPEGLLAVSNDGLRACSPDTRRGISTEGLRVASNEGRRGLGGPGEDKLEVDEEVKPRWLVGDTTRDRVRTGTGLPPRERIGDEGESSYLEPEGGVGVSGGLGGRSEYWLERSPYVGACNVAVEADAGGILTGCDLVGRCRVSAWADDAGGCRLDRLDLSRVGETRAALELEEEIGMEGLDFGDGKACDDKCNAGEDMEPIRREGVT